MHYISTRQQTPPQTLTAAICAGLAKDGGLFVPEHMPQINLADFSVDLPYAVFAEKVLRPFFAGDALEQHLAEICQHAFTFPIPCKQLTTNTSILELFHGPTLSFKDVGARFLAECFNRIAQTTQHKITIIVATSGDTGSAVASAFYQKPYVNVIILYPQGQVSKTQEQQITCWQDNVLALAVKGNFDDCQRLVKDAFQDPWWQQHTQLSSANSINIGRLLPQITYYAYSSMQYYQQHHTAPGYIVPTGNLGNATAAYWAKAMGFPIREIVLATNANKTIPDYLDQGEYKPRASVATLANAMDVGNPSNFERLRYLFNTFDTFKKNVTAFSVSNEEIKKTILNIYQTYHTIICPHTATACFVRQQLDDQPWIITATADPSKFDSVIEPIIKCKIPVPTQLQILLDRPTRYFAIAPSLEEVKKELSKSRSTI